MTKNLVAIVKDQILHLHMNFMVFETYYNKIFKVARIIRLDFKNVIVTNAINISKLKASE